MNPTLDTLTEKVPQLNEYAENVLGASFDTLIWSSFYVLLAFFAIYSALLLYHWLKYGKGYPLIWIGMTAYFVVSFILINSMLISAFSLT